MSMVRRRPGREVSACRIHDIWNSDRSVFDPRRRSRLVTHEFCFLFANIQRREEDTVLCTIDLFLESLIE